MDNTASTIVQQDILRDRESGAARLVAECKQPMYEAALALCGDHAMAEDLVFRTFERVLDRIATCRDESAFTAWMKSILRNEWLMSVRGAAVRNTTPAGLPGEVECMAEPDDGVEAVERSVDAALLRDAIDELPADMREAILLRYFMGLPLLKTAKILAVPVGTINSRLHYARKALAARLGIAAKKPGVKSLLIALALAAMTAVGAVGVAAIRSVAEPEPEEAEVVLNAKSTEETNGDETNGDSPLQVPDDRSIWQGAFTAVNAGSLRYTGLDDADHLPGEFEYENGYTGSDKTMAQYARWDGKQGMLVTVYDDAIVYHRREFYGEESRVLGEDWVQPLPFAQGSAPYAYAVRAAALSAPEFPAGARLAGEGVAGGEHAPPLGRERALLPDRDRGDLLDRPDRFRHLRAEAAPSQWHRADVAQERPRPSAAYSRPLPEFLLRPIWSGFLGVAGSFAL